MDGAVEAVKTVTHSVQRGCVKEHLRLGDKKCITYLENLLRIRPAGVLQLLLAQCMQPMEEEADIRFEEAHWRSENGKSHSLMEFSGCLSKYLAFTLQCVVYICMTAMMYDCDDVDAIYLNGAENPENQSLHHDKARRANTESEVYSDILADLRIHTLSAVAFGPLL